MRKMIFSSIDDRRHFFLRRVMLRDEVTFDMTRHINIHNCRFWWPKGPHEIYEHVQDFRNWICGVTSCVALRTLLQLLGCVSDIFVYSNWCHWTTRRKRNLFPQDGVLAHFSHVLRIVLNVRFPNRWIGRGWSREVQTFHHWIFFCGDLWSIALTPRKSELYVICENKLTRP